MRHTMLAVPESILDVTDPICPRADGSSLDARGGFASKDGDGYAREMTGLDDPLGVEATAEVQGVHGRGQAPAGARAAAAGPAHQSSQDGAQGSEEWERVLEGGGLLVWLVTVSPNLVLVAGTLALSNMAAVCLGAIWVTQVSRSRSRATCLRSAACGEFGCRMSGAGRGVLSGVGCCRGAARACRMMSAD